MTTFALSINDIAKQLGRPHCTIWRRLRRLDIQPVVAAGKFRFYSPEVVTLVEAEMQARRLCGKKSKVLNRLGK